MSGACNFVVAAESYEPWGKNCDNDRLSVLVRRHAGGTSEEASSGRHELNISETGEQSAYRLEQRTLIRGGVLAAMWRLAKPRDDDSIVEMCSRLYDEDPGILAVHPENMRATLRALRREPRRGRAVVLQIERQPSGYALLIAFWSNELGGSICEVDELFVVPEHRNQGHGKLLFEAISRGDLWPAPIVGIALGVTPDNVRARRFYERLGFTAVGISMVRRLRH